MNRAKWTNGKRTVTGRWRWIWHKQRFRIILDVPSEVTSRQHDFLVAGETPEWGNWKLLESEETK